MYTLCKIGKLEYKLKCTYGCIQAWGELTGEKEIANIYKALSVKVSGLLDGGLDDFISILYPLIIKEERPSKEQLTQDLTSILDEVDISEIAAIPQFILTEIERSNTMPGAQPAKKQKVSPEATQ